MSDINSHGIIGFCFQDKGVAACFACAANVSSQIHLASPPEWLRESHPVDVIYGEYRSITTWLEPANTGKLAIVAPLAGLTTASTRLFNTTLLPDICWRN
jgi:hypothetical protein